MNKFMLKLFASTIVISSVFVSQASADLLADVKARGTLNIGTEMQYAPFDFLKDNKQVGYNPDLFAEIAKELGVKVVFQDLPWPSVLPGLTAAKFDMVAGPVTINAKRAEKYRFTSPIDKSAFSLLRGTKDNTVAKLSDINGKVVGGLRGDVSLEALKEIAEQYGAKEVREYGNSGQAYADLAAGRVSVVSNQSANNGFTAAERPEVFSVVPGSFGDVKYVAFVARLDTESESLVEAVNAAIAAIKADGRFAEIQNRWLGQAVDLPAEVDASKL